MRLLLVEDDPVLSAGLHRQLRQQGYAVDVADNGVDARHLGSEESYDLVILDLGLPDLPGLEVLKAWRAACLNMPVLILTARDAWYERVDGLKAGADDYMGKPFHFEELHERIKALIRRQYDRSVSGLCYGSLTLDEERQELLWAGQEEVYPLTAIEFRMLRYFMLHPGVLLSKTRLMAHVYEMDDDKDSNVIEVYVNRLRQKVGRELIQTRRGQGYIFGETAK